MVRELQIQRSRLDDFVADLTDAAYPVAMRHAADEAWLDLELDLWRAMRKTVQKWERQLTQPVGPSERALGDVPGRAKTLGVI